MPHFDAADIVEGLECKLTPFADFDATIPEPSDRQIGEFLTGLKRTLEAARAKARAKIKAQAEQDQKAAQDPDDDGDGELGLRADPEDVIRMLDELDPDDFVHTAEQMATLHSALCSGTPTTAQILSVPMRRRLLFYQWLQLQVMSPEAASPAGNGRVTVLPSRRGA